MLYARCECFVYFIYAFVSCLCRVCCVRCVSIVRELCLVSAYVFMYMVSEYADGECFVEVFFGGCVFCVLCMLYVPCVLHIHLQYVWVCILHECVICDVCCVLCLLCLFFHVCSLCCVCVLYVRVIDMFVMYVCAVWLVCVCVVYMSCVRVLCELRVLPFACAVYWI